MFPLKDYLLNFLGKLITIFTEKLCAGRTAHVMTFEVGAVLEDAKWQAPVYCFENKTVPSEAKAEIGSMRMDGIPRTSASARLSM